MATGDADEVVGISEASNHMDMCLLASALSTLK